MTGGFDSLDDYIRLSEGIPGWTRGEEDRELARISFSLPAEARIVEIGSFFGAGTILLAGPRRLRSSGLVHCVDPSDCSGDLFSIPYYKRILVEAGGGSLRDHFEKNIRHAGVTGESYSRARRPSQYRRGGNHVATLQ
jgi:hypothetical protein